MEPNNTTTGCDHVLMMWRKKNNELKNDLALEKQITANLQTELESARQQANKVTAVEEENARLRQRVADYETKEQQWMSLHKQVDEQKELLELKEDVISDLNRLHSERLEQYESLLHKYNEVNNPQKYIDAFVNAQGKALDSFRGIVEPVSVNQSATKPLPPKKRKIDEIIDTAVAGLLQDWKKDATSHPKKTSDQVSSPNKDTKDASEGANEEVSSHNKDTKDASEGANEEVSSHNKDTNDESEGANEEVSSHNKDTNDESECEESQMEEDGEITETADTKTSESVKVTEKTSDAKVAIDNKSNDDDAVRASDAKEEEATYPLPSRPVKFVCNRSESERRRIKIMPTTLRSSIGYVHVNNL